MRTQFSLLKILLQILFWGSLKQHQAYIFLDFYWDSNSLTPREEKRHEWTIKCKLEKVNLNQYCKEGNFFVKQQANASQIEENLWRRPETICWWRWIETDWFWHSEYQIKSRRRSWYRTVLVKRTKILLFCLKFVISSTLPEKLPIDSSSLFSSKRHDFLKGFSSFLNPTFLGKRMNVEYLPIILKTEQIKRETARFWIWKRTNKNSHNVSKSIFFLSEGIVAEKLTWAGPNTNYSNKHSITKKKIRIRVVKHHQKLPFRSAERLRKPSSLPKPTSHLSPSQKSFTSNFLCMFRSFLFAKKEWRKFFRKIFLPILQEGWIVLYLFRKKEKKISIFYHFFFQAIQK